MKKFYVLSALLLMAVIANAQSIRLQLFDKNNSETIPFAYVHLLSQTGAVSTTVQTDENGIATVIPDQYPATIEIAALGYENAKKSFATPPASTNITFYLVKKFSTLNEVVVTGNSAPVRQRDALSVYKIITREQIQAQGAVSMDEVMKNQLNMTVGYDAMLGTKMDMQGLGADKVKILIDGLPINGREGGAVNLSQILMSNVERIEVIQGPMSVVYGADALGGVINIIMRKEKKPYSINAGGHFETLGRINGDLSISKRLGNRHQVTLSGGRNQFLGWGKYGVALNYDTQSIYHERAYLFKPNEQYMGNVAYYYTAPSDFKLNFASDNMYEKVTNKGNLETWDPFNGARVSDEYYYTRRSMNRLSLSGKLGKKGTWQSQNGYMMYNRIRNSYIKNMTTLEQELNKRNDGMQDTSTFSDIYARGSYNNIVGRLEYTVGYDVSLQFAHSLKIEGGDKEIQDYSAYTNLAYQVIKEKLKVQAGFRGSYNTVYNPPVIPNINLLYTPIKKLQLRASYSQGYRAPLLKEMYLSFIDLNHHIIGNENLKPESSQHVQLSASYQAYEKENDYLQLSVTGFYNDVYNMIALAPLEPDNPSSIKYTYGNLYHRTNVIGTLQADGHYSNLHYTIGGTINRTFAEAGQFDAFTFSEANSTIQYTWKQPGIGFNAFYKLTGRRPFLRSNIDGSASYDGTQAAFHMLDLSLEKKFFDRKLQVIMGVKNVFDFQRPTVSGGSSGTGGGHGGTGAVTGGFLPRSIFTTLRLSIN